MLRTVEVEIDEAGVIHPLDASATIPTGRAILRWAERDEFNPALMPAKSLEDWLRAEEDEA